MNTSFDENLLLSLYLEFFNRCYDISDDRKYDVGLKEILVRHIEMQNIVYILKHLYIPFNYGFMWDFKGPYSSGLQLTLERLDKKGLAIEEFYTEYISKRDKTYHRRYYDQLEDLLSADLHKREIDNVATASFVLEDILIKEQGSEIIAGIIYIGNTVFPGQDLKNIIPELNRRGYYPSPELVESIWKDLAIIGIRDKDTKVFTKERKLISKHDGCINHC